MTASQNANETVQTTGTWKARLAVVVGAVLAAVVVYLIANAAVDGGLQSPAMNDQAPADITIGMVIFVSALASLLGWGLLALLERFAAARARLVWTIIALVVFLLSLGGPLSGSDITGGNRFGLVCMHLAVAAVLITLLPGIGGRRSRSAG
jgi:hypothetical protein